MKHFILSILLLGLVSSSFAQQTEKPPLLTEQDFMTLSRHQKTAAKLLIGAATLGLLVTLTADAGQAISEGLITLFSAGTVEPEYKSYTLPYLFSAAALGSGIALFIAASRSKKKALSLSSYLKMEKAPVLLTGGRLKQTFPAVVLKIGL